jgi:hypothetical protein
MHNRHYHHVDPMEDLDAILDDIEVLTTLAETAYFAWCIAWCQKHHADTTANSNPMGW